MACLFFSIMTNVLTAIPKSRVLTFIGQVPSYEVIRLNGMYIVDVDKYCQTVVTPSPSAEGECLVP